jgi:dolichol-phosphate mannosyltransferase
MLVNQVKNIIIVPSYNETFALPELLSQLVDDLTMNDAILIMDDSKVDIATEIDIQCKQIMSQAKCEYIFINHGKKSGRGAAVRRGMETAKETFPNMEFVIECDADGSHQPKNILQIKNYEPSTDLVIGSRYLPGSTITGWPLSRRIFSYILNKTIPKIFKIHITDITNGLRRYSVSATESILSQKQRNTGFIYLSEQAIVVNNSKLSINEIPIDFIDRTKGESTVSWKEVTNSIRGIMGLFFKSPTIERPNISN